MAGKVYKVLYTHQKTKKSKVWQDGLLREVNNTKLSLVAENGRYVESVFTKADNICVGDEIESDVHLILIDEIEKENCTPDNNKNNKNNNNSNISTPDANKRNPSRYIPPIRPNFVSKRFTPPVLRRTPVTGQESTVEEGREKGEEEYSAVCSSLLDKFQSRQVVRDKPTLVTSLSRTFRETTEHSHTQNQASPNISNPKNRFNTSTKLDKDFSNISSTTLNKFSETRTEDLSSFLQIPRRENVKFKSEQSVEISSTPVVKEQRSIESIFAVLHGATNKSSFETETLCNSESSLNNDDISRCQQGTPDGTVAVSDRTSYTSINATSIAKNIATSNRTSDTTSNTTSDTTKCNFEFFDDSIFSPSPPKCSSELSSESLENIQTFSPSLDGFIEDKIEEIARNVHVKDDKITDEFVSDKANNRGVASNASFYETVDYFDIFGENDEIEESFNPTVIELSTQRNVDNSELELLTQKSIDDFESIPGVSKSAEGGETANLVYSGEEVLKEDVPSCLDWGYEVGSLGEASQSTESRNGEIERLSKRRKMENVFRNPRKQSAEAERTVKKGFSTPFAPGKPIMNTNFHNESNNQELKFGKEPQKRSHVIPTVFSSSSLYKNTMLNAVYEHLNVCLAKVCGKYWQITEQTNTRTNTQIVKCQHGIAKLSTVSKDGPNKGRQFYSCKNRSCELFKWAEGNTVPTNPQERFNYFNRLGLSLYTGCQMRRKANSNLYVLQLTTQDKHVNYNKDDIWIVNPGSPQPSILRSTFHGPSSTGGVELRLLNKHVPSCNGTLVAVQALRAVSELEIVSALDKIHTLPLLPALMERRSDVVDEVCKDITLISDTEEICISMCREYHLNEKQEEAVLALVNSIKHGPPVLCVHGVFGSGKSYLLAVIVLILIRVLEGAQHRILITSTTNVAVDNILIKLLDLGFEHFVRVGSLKKINKRIAPHVMQHQDCDTNIMFLKQDQNRSVLSRYQVVGTTCASSPSVSQHDIVLFDEVSQVTEPSSLLPLIHSSCKRLLLVGDPQQLPPTVETQHEKGDKAGGLEQTLFDRMVKLGYPTVVLNTQYRCPPEISSISNTLFYSGQLRDGNTRESESDSESESERESDSNSCLLPVPPLTFISVPGSESGYGDSYSNQAEVKAISALLEVLVKKKKVTKEDIAIITLYRGQETLLRNELTGYKSLKISTVDAVQGAEKSVIILSCVRTTRIGFADCPKRVNVAITRAKHHLFIFGNIQMLSTNQLWGTIIQICADRGVVLTQTDILNKLQQ